MSLDGFFNSAARVMRRIDAGPETGTVVRQLVGQASELLSHHPQRAAELAFTIQSLKSNDNQAIAHFRSNFASVACQRLPDRGVLPTRAQTHEALISYIALLELDYGQNEAEAARQLGLCISKGAQLLEAPALVGALLRTNKADADVILALQRPLANPTVLKELSISDLCSVARGVAQADSLVPDFVSLLVSTILVRLPQISAAMLIETSPYVVKLSLQMEGGAERAPGLPPQFWEHYVNALRSADDILSARGLLRLAVVVPQAQYSAFVADVLCPNVHMLINAVRTDLGIFGMVASTLKPALHTDACKRAWAELVEFLAVDGFQRISKNHGGSQMLMSILDVVIEVIGEEHISTPSVFPPFFDFVLEELLQRVPHLTARQLRQSVRIMARVHLERPDLLCSAARILADAACSQDLAPVNTAAANCNSDQGSLSDVEVTSLALRSSAFSALYIRVASLNTSCGSKADNHAEKLHDDKRLIDDSVLDAVATVLDKDGQSFEGMLLPLSASPSSTNVAKELSMTLCNATCLMLSALAQPLCRTNMHAGSSARAVIARRGCSLLEAASASWVQNHVKLTAAQSHIFLTALRSFEYGAGALELEPSVAAIIQGILIQASAAPAHDKDTHLCLAMFAELANDPKCPKPLRNMFFPQEKQQSTINSEGVSNSWMQTSPAHKLRAHVKMADVDKPQSRQSLPGLPQQQRSSWNQSLRRLIGF